MEDEIDDWFKAKEDSKAEYIYDDCLKAKEDARVEGVNEGGSISMYALNGSANNDTLKILGQLKKRKITILIDSGSTHSFIDEGTTSQLGCVLKETMPMGVTIAGGGRIFSRFLCTNLAWKIQSHDFLLDFRTIKLGGYDMVLGVDWMTKYGPVSLDFEARVMKARLSVSDAEATFEKGKGALKGKGML
ncbi:uncharacterized protein LOC124924445 [Impatiens glandulifera]|uniref:uncharacterized protein LOC124924445 n=1 Tax=Impatiens glandulifera TaxID=253017 RepID=UPI001FB0E766|nr:uncharacterized protein LOC124924445 [Impatiens glandulifera]